MIDKFIEEKFNRKLQKIDRSLYAGNCEAPVYLGYDPLKPNVPAYVPCGHCASCLASTKKDWIVRNNLHSQQFDNFNKCFITLTLDDEHLDTSYDDFQKFLKWYRRYLEYHFGKKIKYFGCFERGEKTGRPHFHILIYGDNPQYWSIFKRRDYCYVNSYFSNKIWKRGLVKIEELKGEAIHYVVGYVMKKNLHSVDIAKDLNKSRRTINWRNKHCQSDASAGFRRFEYNFSSKGLGFFEFLRRANNIIRRGFINISNFSYSIPRYFGKKIKELFDLDIFEKYRHNFSKFLKFFDWLENNFDKIKFEDYYLDFIHNAVFQYNKESIDKNIVISYNIYNKELRL